MSKQPPTDLREAVITILARNDINVEVFISPQLVSIGQVMADDLLALFRAEVEGLLEQKDVYLWSHATGQNTIEAVPTAVIEALRERLK